MMSKYFSEGCVNHIHESDPQQLYNIVDDIKIKVTRALGHLAFDISKSFHVLSSMVVSQWRKRVARENIVAKSDLNNRLSRKDIPITLPY